MHERLKRQIETGRIGAPIDDGRGSEDACAGRGRDGDGLACRPAGRDDILDDKDAFGRRQRESSSQHEDAVLALGKQRADLSARPTSWPITIPPSAGDSTAVGCKVTRDAGERRAKPFRQIRILQDQRALQVSIAVQPGREPEVPVEQGAGVPEQIENVGLGHAVPEKSTPVYIGAAAR